MEAFERQDSKDLFDTNMSHLRLILNQVEAQRHVSITKWTARVGRQVLVRQTCVIIWQPFLATKESCFAWQTLFHILATNKWRWPTLPNTDDAKKCKRYTLLALETISHCLWDCPHSRAIWNWVSFIAPLTSQQPDQTISLTGDQALIGRQLNCGPHIPLKWWQAL